MSKQVRKKNIPTPASASSSDDDDLPPTMDSAAVVEESPAEASTGTGVEDVAAVAGPSAPTDADFRWQQMAEQLETLKDVLAQLCHLVTPRTAMGRAEGGPQALPCLRCRRHQPRGTKPPSCVLRGRKPPS
ncbi:unnamed protein product [Lampetra planeri]